MRRCRAIEHALAHPVISPLIAMNFQRVRTQSGCTTRRPQPTAWRRSSSCEKTREWPMPPISSRSSSRCCGGMRSPAQSSWRCGARCSCTSDRRRRACATPPCTSGRRWIGARCARTACTWRCRTRPSALPTRQPCTSCCSRSSPRSTPRHVCVSWQYHMIKRILVLSL